MANEVKIIGQCIEGIKAEAETIEEMISQLDYDILQANDQIDILFFDYYTISICP